MLYSKQHGRYPLTEGLNPCCGEASVPLPRLKNLAGNSVEGQAAYFIACSYFTLQPNFTFPSGDKETSLYFEGAGVVGSYRAFGRWNVAASAVGGWEVSY